VLQGAAQEGKVEWVWGWVMWGWAVQSVFACALECMQEQLWISLRWCPELPKVVDDYATVTVTDCHL